MACSMLDGSRAARALSRLSCRPFRTKSAPISATLTVLPVACGDQRMCPRSLLRLREWLPNRRRLPLQPDVCIWVVCVVGRARSDPPARCVYLGGFVVGAARCAYFVGRCVVGRARSDPALPPPPPATACPIRVFWVVLRSGIDPHYLWRKTITTDRRQVV